MTIQKVYLSDILVILILGSIWVPQIYRNTVKGYRNTPSINYAICQSLHSICIPMYIKGSDNNFLALKPHLKFIIFLIVWVCIQIIIL